MSQETTVTDTLVTVCVAAYNRPEGIYRVLECMLCQTHRKLKIIISDDHSPNMAVWNIIEHFASSDSRIEPYRQIKNIGFARNMKFLLDKVESDYFIWCDDDDWYDPFFIEKCLNSLIKNPAVQTAFTYYCEVNENGDLVRGYPNQGALLDALTNTSVFFRVFRYLFKFGGYGYCNILYGLHRSNIKQWFEPEDYFKKYGLILDQVFGMKLVSISPVIIINEMLMKKTVNNRKEYLLKDHIDNTSKNIFQKILMRVLRDLQEVKSYIRVVGISWHAFMIFVLAPIWIITDCFDAGLKTLINKRKQ